MPTSARFPTSRIDDGRTFHGRHGNQDDHVKNLDTFSHIGLFKRRVDSLDDVNNTPVSRKGQARVRELRQQGSWRRKTGEAARRPGGDPRRIPMRSRNLASTVTITCRLRRPRVAVVAEKLRELARCCSKRNLSRPPPSDLPRPARRSPRPRRRLFASMPAGSRPLRIRKGQVWSPDQGFEAGNTIDRDPNTVIAGTEDPEYVLDEH